MKKTIYGNYVYMLRVSANNSREEEIFAAWKSFVAEKRSMLMLVLFAVMKELFSM